MQRFWLYFHIFCNQIVSNKINGKNPVKLKTCLFNNDHAW
jgi:hypothetical protein